MATILGTIGNDKLTGTAGNDFFPINYGNDTLSGGGGNDIFEFDSASGHNVITDFDVTSDKLNLGSWSDAGKSIITLDRAGNSLVVVYSSHSTITLLGVGQDQWAKINLIDTKGATIANQFAPDLSWDRNNSTIDQYRILTGTNFNDIIIGSQSSEYFLLSYGNDTITGSGGTDIFEFDSSSGHDVITDFDVASDKLALGHWATSRATTINLNASGDTVIMIGGINGSVTLKGIGAAQWSQLKLIDIQGRTVSNGLEPAPGWDPSNIDWGTGGANANIHIYGSPGSDSLSSSGTSSRINAQGGNDTITPGGRDDTIDGGDGIDTVVLNRPKASYEFLVSGNRFYAEAPGQFVELTNVEKLQFSDQTMDITTLTAAPPPNAIYRFYNESNGAHFYTNNVSERNALINTATGFNFEGAAFESTGSAGSSVWRFFNSQTGTHFYTISTTERDAIQNTLPNYIFEGEAYKASENAGSGLNPLFRFYNTAANTHFFTANEAERDAVLATLPHFQFEGTAFYVDLI